MSPSRRRIARRSHRRVGQRVAKPARQEAHAIVEQAVAGEVRAHLLEADGQVVALAPQAIAAVGGVALRIGLGQAGEGVRQPDEALRVAVHVEQRAHEDRRAAAPDARLDEVAGNAVGDHVGDARLELLEARDADHRVADRRPADALGADLGVGPAQQRVPAPCQQPLQGREDEPVKPRSGDDDVVRRARRAGQRALEQIDVAGVDVCRGPRHGRARRTARQPAPPGIVYVVVTSTVPKPASSTSWTRQSRLGVHQIRFSKPPR